MMEREGGFSPESPEFKLQALEAKIQKLEQMAAELGFSETQEVLYAKYRVTAIPSPEFNQWADMAEKLGNTPEAQIGYMIVKSAMNLRLGNITGHMYDIEDILDYAHQMGIDNEIIDQIGQL